jgi:ribosomal-protein-alanine N-acetyltransferase
MKESMEIREIESEDMNRVFEIEISSFDSPYDPLVLNHLFRMYKKTFLVACEKHVIGYIIGIIDRIEAHILSLAIDEEYRGKKVGSILVQRLMELFKQNGVKKVRLEVRKSNIKAQNLYKKLGFFEAEELPQYYENGEDGILMVRVLKEKA